MRITLTVPMPENIGNGGHYHWRTRYSKREAYMKRLDGLQLRGLIPPPPRRALRGAKLTSVMYLGNAMDMDNAMRRHKDPVDWLKTRGYIVDDGPLSVTWAAFPEQVVKRGQEYRIEITLVENLHRERGNVHT